MYHPRRDFSLLAENKAQPSLTIDCEPLTRRKGFFPALLNALHESRRLQAQRVFTQYRHLIAKDPVIKAPESIPECVSKGNLDMPIANASRTRQSRSLKPWIIVTAIAFCVLHVVGGLMLSAPSTRPAEMSVVAMRGD